MHMLFYLFFGFIAALAPLQSPCQEYGQVIEAIDEITIENFDEEFIEISWPATGEEDAVYCLYGSETDEFALERATLISVFSDNKIKLDTAFPYYYILVSQQGQLSEASPPHCFERLLLS